MKKLFSVYPRLTFILLGIYALEQCCYFYACQLYAGFSLEDEYLLDADYLPVQLLEGIIIILGGYLASRISDQKKALLWGLSLLLLGHLLTFLDNDYIGLFGFSIITLGSSIFILTIFLHNAILYPIANDFKDNSFMFFFFMTSFVLGLVAIGLDIFVEFPVPGEGQSEYPISILFVSTLLFGVAFLTTYNTKQLGYKIEEEEETKESEATDYKPFFVFILAANILTLAYNIFSRIGDDSIDFLDYSFESTQIITFGMLIIVLILPFILMQTAKYYSRHYFKIQILIATLIVTAILEFSITTTLSYEMDVFTRNLFTIIYIFLLSPLLFSVLTHLHFDRKGIILLGFLVGSIQITSSLANHFYYQFKTPMIIGAGCLLIVLLIWLRENKDFILSHLLLDESNQEEEERNEDESDLLDHLIE